jgi:hypothetical protein
MPNSFHKTLSQRLDCNNINAVSWFTEEGGAYWELLNLGSDHWQKGRIKVSINVEFIPDEENESPLDDIRKTIN